MPGRRLCVVSMAATVVFTGALNAYTTNLYDSYGNIGYFGNIGDTDGDYPTLTGTTGQQFNASDPALPFALPATAVIDRVAMRIAIDPNRPSLGDPGSFQFKIRLWSWNNDLATTMAAAPLADSGALTWAGGYEGWIHLDCPPQPASGTYFIAVTRLNLAINGQWRVARTAESGAAASVCYRAGSAKSDRELQIQLHWYDTPCAATTVTTVTGLTGNAFLTETNPATVTLTGTNLDLLTSVTLQRRHYAMGGNVTTIAGVLQTPASGMTSRQAFFNLTGAEAGLYTLALASACDRIANTAEVIANDGSLLRLKNTVLVYMPSLTNASFEEAWNDNPVGGYCSTPRGTDLEDPKHWGLSVSMEGVSGNQWRRDGAVYVPGCASGQPAGGDGLHYASQVTNSIWPIRNTAFQTIIPPELTGQVVQRGTVFRLSYHLSQATDQLTLRLRDGGPGGPQIAARVLPYTGTAPLQDGPAVTLEAGYTFVSSPPLLTIEIQMDEDAGTAPHGLHFDNLRATIGCNLPFADADGDHDVDSVDFAVWQRCYSPATSIPSEPAYCACFERVANNHIDEADLAAFTKCQTGPDIPWVQCDP